MSKKVLENSNIVITENIGEWHTLSAEYGVPVQEIGLIDFNRTGVVLDNQEVRVGFRTRFNGNILYKDDLSWYALPVRESGDSNFHIDGNKIFFKDYQIGLIDEPILDTCDTSYQRGKKLLNLNSRSRSNCAGCKACVHNDKSLYDNTVIRDRRELITRDDIARFFREKARMGVDIAALEQIAVVTGLFYSEWDALGHMQLVHEVASRYGFHGELMYFGCQIMSPGAIREFAKLGNTAIVFAIDNFSNRKQNLSEVKADVCLDNFYLSMSAARACGVGCTFAYIAGVDNLDIMASNVKLFAETCTRFPIVNIFQIQTDLQAQALADEARNLEYYIKARLIIEDAFRGRGLLPRRWENYRPLWYREFDGVPLDVKPYG